MQSETSDGDQYRIRTLEAWADTFVPGAKRWPDDRTIAGAATGPGAVEAGAVELLQTPATGVSEFVTQEAIAIKSFKPGLRIVGVDSDTAWATTPAPQRAACYWISALLRTSPLNY